MISRGPSLGFGGFLARMLITLPVWFLTTAVITYVLLRALGKDPPFVDAILALNLMRMVEPDLIIGLPITLFSAFIGLIIVWAVFWR